MSGSSSNIKLPWRRGSRLRRSGRARAGDGGGGGMLQAGVKGAVSLIGQILLPLLLAHAMIQLSLPWAGATIGP